MREIIFYRKGSALLNRIKSGVFMENYNNKNTWYKSIFILKLIASCFVYSLSTHFILNQTWEPYFTPVESVLRSILFYSIIFLVVGSIPIAGYIFIAFRQSLQSQKIYYLNRGLIGAWIVGLIVLYVSWNGTPA